MQLNLAIFASGSGTNAENIVKYFDNNRDVNVKLIITNNPNAFVIQRAKLLKVETLVFNNTEWKQPKSIIEVLQEKKIDVIILAGFLLRISKDIIDIYTNKVINIHPALLPKYGGKGMYGDNVHKAVIEAKDKVSGITIHYCNEHYDQGDIIFQATCPVLPEDNYEDLAKRIHQLEYENFPKVIELVLNQLNRVS